MIICPRLRLESEILFLAVTTKQLGGESFEK